MEKTHLNRMSNEDLLNLKMKDLNLSINGSQIDKRLLQLFSELEGKGLIFKPHVWISDEWFTPDDTAGFAIPFYLFHPRLIKLEKEQMYEAEGEGRKECMQILRHETGHAISHAYQLYKLRSWKNLFGDFRKPYPLRYSPDIKSKNYVTHLNAWYAQAHPLEDFAETFAVWLDSKSMWSRIYKNWSALSKLEYIDNIMNQIRERKPILANADEYVRLSEINYTVGEHYRRKKKFYTMKWAQSFDIELKKIFTEKVKKPAMSAELFLKSARRSIRKNISDILDVPQYTVDQLLRELITRSVKLNLHLRTDKDEAIKKLIIIITAQIINLSHSGYYRIPL